MTPQTKVEKKSISEGYHWVFGLDEAGRGPLAGPVVAAAVWVDPIFLDKDFKNRSLIKDSKLLNFKKRELIFNQLSKSNHFFFGIGEVSNQLIDKINILNATFLAMRLALNDLIFKIKKNQEKKRNGSYSVNFLEREKICLLIDGNQRIPRVELKQKIFPQGDKRIFSIAIASIFAKVFRDRKMLSIHQKFPLYGFASHKGYGTKEHLELIKKIGICPYHRCTFGFIKKIAKKVPKEGVEPSPW